MIAQSLSAGRIGLAPLGRIAPCAVEQSIAQARALRLRAHQRFGDETSKPGDDIDRRAALRPPRRKPHLRLRTRR